VKVAAEGVYSVLAEVKIQEGESIESALRRFKRKVQQEDIIKDIKKHSFYLKPGDRRRASRRWRVNVRARSSVANPTSGLTDRRGPLELDHEDPGTSGPFP